MWWVLLAVGFGLTALLGTYVAAQKGRSLVEGFVLGLLFGPLGVLVVALLPAQAIERYPVRYEEPEPEGEDPLEPAQIDLSRLQVEKSRAVKAPNPFDRLKLD